MYVHVVANDTDADGDLRAGSVRVLADTVPVFLSVSVADPALGLGSGVLAVVPAVDFTGWTSFAYSVADSRNLTAQATVRIYFCAWPLARSLARTLSISVSLSISLHLTSSGGCCWFCTDPDLCADESSLCVHGECEMLHETQARCTCTPGWSGDTCAVSE